MWHLFLNLAFGHPQYELGVNALKQKKYSKAETYLKKCTADEPQNIPCHWELGWVYWMKSDWPKVVENWKIVQKLDPKHPEINTYLPQAVDNVKLLTLMEQDKKDAPESFDIRQDSSLRIRAVGDMMIGTSFPRGYLPKNDGKDAFKKVRSLLKDADITFGNLEGPLCDSGTSSKCRKQHSTSSTALVV